MPKTLLLWLRISLFNLFLVAVIGCILRYKIILPLPFVDQKYLLHAHNNFAFTGWITQTLMVLMVAWLSKDSGAALFRKYQWLFYANLITAYGMLCTFPIEGFGIFSISFSTLSIITSYIFTIRFWIDMNRLAQSQIGHYWFKAALIFNVMSSLGVFGLTWMMVTKNINLQLYLGANYFFLHFKYNGWFFFACMGLFTVHNLVPVINEKILKSIFWLFALACVPAYFLSALWMPIPLWGYILVIIAAVLQFAGWIWMLIIIKRYAAGIKTIFSKTARHILVLSAIALSLKLLLQLGSTNQSLSNLVFGFRPIVIGYLHLVLLGVITLFLMGYIIGSKYLLLNRTMIWGISIFAAGIIINEVLLMIQGAGGLGYVNIPYLNESLLVAACIMMCGILTIFISQFRKNNDDPAQKTYELNASH